jgi:predicted dehydrogenase
MFQHCGSGGNNMTEKLTMAVIGFGKSATRYHLPYLMLRDNIQVKWVYARHLNKRPAEQEFYKQHHVQFTDNVTEVLSDPAVKLVTICLPPALHFAFAKRCFWQKCAGRETIY